MIDVTKPLVTRKGKAVVVLTTEGPDKDFPIVGHLVGSSTMRLWNTDGFVKGKNRTFDLEKATPCDPFTTEVTDGHGRVMLRLLVVPEDNKVIVEKADCNLEKEGVNLLENPVYHIPADTTFHASPATQPLQQTPVPKGHFIKEKPRPAGGLATAFYNSLKNGNGIDIQEG